MIDFCILVSGLLDAFVTAFILRRTRDGYGLNFGELMCGRIKMMTVLCPAWAHTYQTMCFGFSPEPLRLEAFQYNERLVAIEVSFSYLFHV